VPGRPIVINGAVADNDVKNVRNALLTPTKTYSNIAQEVCNVHNANSIPPPQSSTTGLPPAPTPEPVPTSTPEPVPTPEPEPEPVPVPHTAACKVLEQGLGGGTWEVSGSGWGDEGSLKAKFGDDSFTFSGGDPWTASFNSGMSAGDIENAVRDMSGIADVKCTL
jgi:hypothetical protein